jgi:hypothetical protein
MSITLKQYAGPHGLSRDWTQERQRNAEVLLLAVNKLMAEAALAGVEFPVNPKTGSQISGQTYGGFRPQLCPIGAPNSNHKEGRGVDVYDPENKIDDWCMVNQDVLEECGIWIEHPSKTNTWSHWQSVAPKSGNRVYMP